VSPLAQWHRLVRRLAHREAGTSLALFRAGIGAVVLGSLLHMAWADAVVPIWMDRDYGGVMNLRPRGWLGQHLDAARPGVVWPLFWGAVTASAALMVGVGGRLTALITLQLALALFDLAPGTGGGHDKLLTNALWLLVLAPATATLSVDCRLRTGAWQSDRPVAAWVRYVAVVQLCLVYGVTGIQKLGAEWMPWGGWSALYYSLLLPSWARWDLTWIAHVYPLTQLATVVTWLWEVTFPVVLLCFWFRATRGRPGRLRHVALKFDLRSVYAAVGVCLHLGIWATMNVGPFSWAALAWYVCLFHPDELAALAGRVRARRDRAAAAPAKPTG